MRAPGERRARAAVLLLLSQTCKACGERPKSPFMDPASGNTKLSSARKMEKLEFGVFTLSGVGHQRKAKP